MTSNTDQPSFLHQDFANRLRKLLKDKGFESTAASSGVKVAQLATAAGCSQQMARRYTLGEALPDYKTILKMAQWFDVPPGWLLFGDNQTPPKDLNNANLLHMDMELFTYILKNAIPLIKSSSDHDETLCFIEEVLQDAMHMKTDKKMMMKLIDVAMSSANRFQTPQTNTVNITKKKMKQHRKG